VAAGAAAAALGAGVAFGLQARSTNAQIVGAAHERLELDSLQGSLRAQAGRANVFFAVGGGLAAAATTLYVLRF
jgi:hypothetical protein